MKNTDTDIFTVYIKTDDIYNVEYRFDTSNYKLERLLPKRKKKSNWINER